MTEMEAFHTEQNVDHTDVFIVAGNDNNEVEFVTIDDTFADLSDAVVIIDMSDDEIIEPFAIDARIDSDLFVMLDNNVIVSGFSDEDFNSSIVDIDIINDIQEI